MSCHFLDLSVWGVLFMECLYKLPHISVKVTYIKDTIALVLNSESISDNIIILLIIFRYRLLKRFQVYFIVLCVLGKYDYPRVPVSCLLLLLFYLIENIFNLGGWKIPISWIVFLPICSFSVLIVH